MRLFASIVLLVILVSGIVLSIHIVESIRRVPVDTSTDRIPPAHPNDWIMKQRLFPYGDWDRASYREALTVARRMKASSKRGAGLGTWELLGPTNIGGRIVDIEIDPVQPHIVYAAAATGGVFRSTDSGTSWSAIFDDQAMLNIGDIGIDPNNPEILYVGTGEANPSANNLAGGGIYKSSDSGQTWSFIGLEGTEAIARIIVDPSNSDRVFVAAVGSYFSTGRDRGVYRSEDAGLSWSNVLSISDSTGAIDLVMHPGDSNILFAAMWERARRPRQATLFGPTSGIYKSTDGGDSWTRLGSSNGLPDSEVEAVGRIGLAISLSHPDILYALFTDGFSYLGLYKTIDGGDTWFDADPYKGAGIGMRSFSWFFGQVRVHPEDPDKVYILDVEFLCSSDGGNSWTGIPGNTVLHVDHHALAFHPHRPDYIIEGNDGGINISADAGVTWRKVKDLPITQFYEVGLDPNNPERIYGGTQDNGTLRTLSGMADDWRMLPMGVFSGGDGFYVFVPEEDSDFIYAESQYGRLSKSTDGGVSFASLAFSLPPLYKGAGSLPGAEPRNWNTPVVLDPNDDAVLYYGTHRIHRSTTRGTSWRPVSESLTDWAPGTLFGTLTAIAVAPSNSNVIYAGTDDGHVWVTDDYGQNWTEISSALPYRWVTRLAVDPYEASNAYVTFSGLKWHDRQPHVFRTRDMGQTWTDVSANLPDAPVNVVVIDPLDTDILYVGTDVGAFVSFDAGLSWESLGTGLPAVAIFDLDIHPDTRILFAGTHGRSMYGLDLSSFATNTDSQPTENPTPAYSLLPNFPDPFSHQTTLPFQISQSTTVQIRVFDLMGRQVATLLDATIPAGRHETTWDGRNMRGNRVTAGAYFIQLYISDRFESIETQMVTVIR